MPANLRLLRALAAPPERVWRALTDPAALTGWFWPERLDPSAEADLGGRYRIASELTPSADGTELTLVHEGFADDDARDDHVKGWTDCLDRLPGWLASDRG